MFGEIPCLQNTILCNVVVDRKVGKGFGARFLPSFQPKTAAGSLKKEDGVVKSYNPADWDKFYQHLFDSDNINVVGIATEKNSNGPDVALHIQDSPPSASNQLPDLIYQCGFASKNLQRGGSTNWKDIEDEVEKGLVKPLQNEVLKGKLRAVLVIASTQLMGEIEMVVNGKHCIVCDAGTWAYHKKDGKLEKGKGSKDGWMEKFTVPESGELVILSKAGMAGLLGNSTLDTLSGYFARDEMERCENLLSMELALGSLVRKPKYVDGDVNQFALVPHTSGRTIELTFVDSASGTEVGNGMADVPFGTSLSAMKTKVEGVLEKKAPGRVMTNLKWGKVIISDDDEMDAVKDRHEVIVLLQ
jgi:hypothetical protein